MASFFGGSKLEKKSQSKITALKDQALDYETKLNLGEINEEQLSQEVLRLQSDVLRQQKEYDELGKSSQDQIAHFTNVLKQKDQKIRELEAKNREAVGQLEEAKKVQQSKDEEVEGLISMIHTLGKQTETQSKYAEKQDEEFKEMLRTKDEQILELQSTLATQKAEIAKLKENHKKQITIVKKMLQQKDEKLSDLRSLIDDNERAAIDREEEFKEFKQKQEGKEKHILGIITGVMAHQREMEAKLSLIMASEDANLVKGKSVEKEQTCKFNNN